MRWDTGQWASTEGVFMRSDREQKRAREELQDRIGRASPEGRPAHPEWGIGSIGLAVAAVVVLVCAVAIAVGVLFSPLAGIVALVLGLAVAVVGNPTIWASGSRAKEREEILKESEE